ncbi:MAG: twin-arginine translocase subunit TatB [Woeseiaceae bacterium]|nr:twin-arginine translocase subunit TatB [Woeseiaceae bacterium]
MSGIGFFELVILFMIGLVVLGPKRLPKVANQIGTWVGQARRMTRVMRRQLEEELDLSEDLKDLKNIGAGLKEDLTIAPGSAHVPRDDDTYSPLHEKPTRSVAGVKVDSDDASAGAEDETDAAPTDEDLPDEDSPENTSPNEKSPDEKPA